MDNQVLTTQELEHLAEVREVTFTINSPGWHRILAQIETFVREAFEDMLAATPATRDFLFVRWQQREATLRGIRHYVTSCQEARKALLSEVKERSVPVEPYAEQDRETAGWENPR